MSTAEDVKAEMPDYLDMSDEDMRNLTEPAPVAAEPEVTAPAEEEDADDSSIQSSDEQAEGAADQASTEASEEAEDKEDQVAESKEAAVTEAKPAEIKPAEKAIDYEAEYKRLLAPFKANGREVAVGSVDDAVALMQMGANYNKKMAALKPNLRLMKLLENNGLMSEEKISFLIELEKKNPDAINKLVKDSNLNPMDFDAEKAGEYKPTIHTVDDREIALDTVLEEISTTPTYNRTLEVVSKKWDGASKQVIADTPQLLQVINNHISNGVYDLISAEVERERMFGRLNGLSDIEAYRQVGDAIQARGGFNHLGSSQGNSSTNGAVVAPKPKKVDDARLNDKRRAASSTKPANTSVPATDDFNPLSMSDEEFAKQADKRFR